MKTKLMFKSLAFVLLMLFNSSCSSSDDDLKVDDGPFKKPSIELSLSGSEIKLQKGDVFKLTVDFEAEAGIKTILIIKDGSTIKTIEPSTKKTKETYTIEEAINESYQAGDKFVYEFKLTDRKGSSTESTFTLFINEEDIIEDEPKGVGTLFIIGGGERPADLMQNFINLAGGRKKNVLVIPFASTSPTGAGLSQREEFLRLGVTSCDIILSSKESLDKEENLEKIKKANLVYFTDGDQDRLSEYLNGTEFLNSIKSFYNERGGIIGSTGGAAAAMSEIMITESEKATNVEKDKGKSIARNNIITKDGLGLMKNVVIDHHFLYEKRNNRLFSVLLDNPKVKGIGIDESTVIIVKADKTFEVIGESKVMVLEPQGTLPEGIPPVFNMRVLFPSQTYKL